MVAAWEAMLPDGDPLEVAKAAEAMIGFCQARQLVAFNEVYQESEAGADPDGVVVDPCPPEIACAMLWSRGVRLGDGRCGGGCRCRFPCRGGYLAEARMIWAALRGIIRATSGLELSRPGGRWPTGPSPTRPPTRSRSCVRG